MRNKLAKAIRKDVQFVPANERANATRRNGEADAGARRRQYQYAKRWFREIASHEEKGHVTNVLRRR